MSVTVDLHLHTTASDGRLSPTQLIQLAAERGIKTAAVTDHDTTEGLAEAFAAARAIPGFRLIPGIELSADVTGDEVHILGYFLQYEAAEFQATLRRFRLGRVERGRLIVEKLAGLGLPVSWERVQEIAGDGAVGRPHIALAMVEKGYFKEPKDAFEKHLGRDGLAYVERERFSPGDAVRFIQSVGGVAVLAHPTYIKDMNGAIAEVKAAGAVGMEVHYAKYDTATIQHLIEVSARHSLIPCGGSDYHALGNTDEPLPGVMGPPEETVARLEAAAKLTARR